MHPTSCREQMQDARTEDTLGNPVIVGLLEIRPDGARTGAAPVQRHDPPTFKGPSLP